jgi:elongation factor Ts
MIDASLVKDLREQTGAGMMDCKKALEATKGNITEAIDWLREKGISKAEKKASRIAAEGLANIYTNDKKAVILEINSETDFVSKNAEFKNMLDDIGKTILNGNAKTMDEVMELTIGDTTIENYIVAKIAKIGEKLSFRRFEIVEKAADENFGAYLHMGGKIAVLTVIKGGSPEIAKDIAMQAAAMKPKYTLESDVTEADLAKEKAILKEQAMNEGKPEAIAEKMMAGRIKKFYQESCLIDQEFIKDNTLDVKTYLKNNQAELVKMIRYEVGEGLEHRSENFADEVMKQVNGK